MSGTGLTSGATEPKAKEDLLARQDSYKTTFHGVNGQEVLKDLSRFCREKESCFTVGDPYATALLEGRREVILRILDHLEMPPDDLWLKYGEGQDVER